jgi:hypothetical protein
MTKGLYQFLSYYGAKKRSAKHYPPPTNNTIIEPFAGSAGYSLLYYDRQVKLYDINPKLVAVWSYLIKATKSDILNLPLLTPEDTVDSFNISQEEKWFIGWWLHMSAGGAPRKRLSPWGCSKLITNSGSAWGYKCRERIANQVDRIKHWTIDLMSYDQIPNQEATWFIDPPYQGKNGKAYKYHSIDYDNLSQWCQNRIGQSIACEEYGANWLPFKPLKQVSTHGGARHKMPEGIWTNDQQRCSNLCFDPTPYDGSKDALEDYEESIAAGETF